MAKPRGLTPHKVQQLRQEYGANVLQDTSQHHHMWYALLLRFRNPLVIILLLAATLSLFFGDKPSFFIIVVIVFLSVGLDLLNTHRSEVAAEALKDKVRVKAQVIRAGKAHHVPVSDLVPGDIVLLSAGKIVPADGVMVESTDLYTNEAALTGESFPQGKPVNAEVFM